MSFLERINDPSDLKKLALNELKLLSREIRTFLIEHVSQTGGHLSSNLGIVELTIALHYVFKSPHDKIIFDIGHQSYVHKILTGRKHAFHTLRQKDGISGFTRRNESVHDILNTGHASNSISVGLGLLSGQEFKSISGKVICVIGDGSLSGGLALAGLNNAGRMKKNLIVVVNDNKMSISKNVGAVHDYLSRLTATKKYHQFKRFFDRIIPSLPIIGPLLAKILFRVKRSIKAMFFKQTLFSDLGFEYVGPLHGHQLKDLISVLKNAASIACPIVVHVITEKGHGYDPAIKDPLKYHGVTPFNSSIGIMPVQENLKTFTQIASETIIEIAEKDKSIVAITAAMPTGTGLASFAKQFPTRFFDVGISEEHAVSFASGLALAGMKPIVAIYSTFFQRSVDQVIHDIVMQGMLCVVFLLDRAGFVPGDGENHHGLYDIAIFRGIPNLNILAPATAKELQLMIHWALKQNHSSLIRYPKDIAPGSRDDQCAAIRGGEGILIKNHQNSLILFISVGSILQQVIATSNILHNTHNIACNIYNLRFILPLSQYVLSNIIQRYAAIVVVEEGTKSGGIGECIAKICLQIKPCAFFEHIGVSSVILGAGSRSELLKEAGLNSQNIIDIILKINKNLNNARKRSRSILDNSLTQ